MYKAFMQIYKLYGNLFPAIQFFKIVKYFFLYILLIDTMYRKPFKIILGSKSHLTSSNEAPKSYRLIFDKVKDYLIIVIN